MTNRVAELAEQVKALPEEEREEFLAWLAEFTVDHEDAWDRQIAEDSQAGGKLESLLKRVRRDIVEQRTKPLDEVVDDG
jgi:hypothetical protein